MVRRMYASGRSWRGVELDLAYFLHSAIKNKQPIDDMLAVGVSPYWSAGEYNVNAFNVAATAKNWDAFSKMLDATEGNINMQAHWLLLKSPPLSVLVRVFDRSDGINFWYRYDFETFVRTIRYPMENIRYVIDRFHAVHPTVISKCGKIFHHNAQFDLRHAMYRCLKHGMPFKDIDPRDIVRPDTFKDVYVVWTLVCATFKHNQPGTKLSMDHLRMLFNQLI